MEKKLSLKELLRGKIARLGLKEIFPAAATGKQFSRVRVHLINRKNISVKKNNIPTIAIITPLALNQFCNIKEKHCRKMPDNLFQRDYCLIILSNISSIPDFLKKPAAKYDLPIAASKYDEHYLKSILQEVIREKYRETILIHGVILDAEGKGILITGDSGIGKTTAVLKAAVNDYYWVADDVAVIKRNSSGELIAGGHKKIDKYLYTESSGIIPVVSLLEPNRIRTKTKLVAIINIVRTKGRKILIAKGEKIILGIKLTSLSVNLPSTSFFDDNLLKISVREILKDNS